MNDNKNDSRICAFCSTEVPRSATICTGCHAEYIEESNLKFGLHLLTMFIFFPFFLLFFGGVGFTAYSLFTKWGYPMIGWIVCIIFSAFMLWFIYAIIMKVKTGKRKYWSRYR